MAVRITPSMSRTIASVRAGPSVRPISRNATNVVYKPRRKKFKKKAQVSKSYRIAYNKMAPSKEIRYDIPTLTMATDNVTDPRTYGSYLDAIGQGTAIDDRLGSNVHISYLHLAFTLGNNSGVKGKGVRVVVFREVNLGLPVIGTYSNFFKGIGTTTSAATGTQTDLTYRLNKELLYPIFDKVYKVPMESEDNLQVFKKIRINRMAKYTPTLSADTTPYHGRLQVVFFLADYDNNTTGSTCILKGLMRVFFKDGHKSR